MLWPQPLPSLHPWTLTPDWSSTLSASIVAAAERRRGLGAAPGEGGDRLARQRVLERLPAPADGERPVALVRVHRDQRLRAVGVAEGDRVQSGLRLRRGRDASRPLS